MRSVVSLFLIALLACSSFAAADDGLSKEFDKLHFGVPHRLEKRATDVLSLNSTETYILFRITAPSSLAYVYSFTSTVTVSAYILSSTQYIAYTPTVNADNTITPPTSYNIACSPCQRVTTCPSSSCSFTAGTWYVVIIESTPATGTVVYTDNISSSTTGTGGTGTGNSGTGTSPSPLAVSPASTSPSSSGGGSTSGNSSSSGSDSGLSLGAIIGIAVGGVVVIAGAIIGVLLVRRKKPAAAANTVPYTPAQQYGPPTTQYSAPPASPYTQYDPRASYQPPAGYQPPSQYAQYPATTYQPASPYPAPATTYQPVSPYPAYSVPPPAPPKN